MNIVHIKGIFQWAVASDISGACTLKGRHTRAIPSELYAVAVTSSQTQLEDQMKMEALSAVKARRYFKR